MHRKPALSDAAGGSWDLVESKLRQAPTRVSVRLDADDAPNSKELGGRALAQQLSRLVNEHQEQVISSHTSTATIPGTIKSRVQTTLIRWQAVR